MFDNIVIGKPLCSPVELFSYNLQDWEETELKKTMFTQERFLPRIMVDCGMVKSTSEIKRNRPELCISLDEVDFKTIKWGKKFIWIMVGE